MTWIKTDDFQWINEIEEGIYKCINIYENEDGSWLVINHFINVNEELEYIDDLQKILDLFGYKNIDDVIEIYGYSYKQIIAECISEERTIGGDSIVLDDWNELKAYLESININDLV